MIIWIVTIGEPIINNKNNLRLHRHGLLAEYISKNSKNKVIWWTSKFNHFTKEFEMMNDEEYYPNRNLTVKLLKGTGYKKNVSISRIIDHLKIKKSFSKKIRTQNEKPDIIISSFPTLGLCQESLKFGEINNIPVIIDYRDLWPEAFSDLFPSKINFIGKILLSPLYFSTNKMLKNATGIIGITESFLNIALQKINREKNNFDAYFPHTYKKLNISHEKINDSLTFWKEFGIDPNSNFINICFFGTLGYQFDLETVIKGFSNLQNPNIRLIICGSGHKKASLEKLAKNNPNIIFPGYINAIQIKSLLTISHIGLCPYLPKKMFLEAIPGKVIEYMSEGLELITTLGKGVVGNMVEDKNFGLNYDAFDSDSFSRKISELYKKIKSNGNQKSKIIDYYNKNFDQETVLKNYLTHVKKVVKDYV